MTQRSCRPGEVLKLGLKWPINVLAGYMRRVFQVNSVGVRCVRQNETGMRCAMAPSRCHSDSVCVQTDFKGFNLHCVHQPHLCWYLKVRTKSHELDGTRPIWPNTQLPALCQLTKRMLQSNNASFYCIVIG